MAALLPILLLSLPLGLLAGLVIAVAWLMQALRGCGALLADWLASGWSIQ